MKGHRGDPPFLDLKDAIYTVVLQFIYNLPTTPDELNDIFHELKIPEIRLPALEAATQGAPVFDNQVEDERRCDIGVLRCGIIIIVGCLRP